MKFRKKPVVIEAIQWNGENLYEILTFGQDSIKADIAQEGTEQYKQPPVIKIKTLESGHGHHIASVNDWIIKGVKGEFYPCKPDIFEMTYELVNDTNPLQAKEEKK